MVLVNDNWEDIKDLQDISKIIREYFNTDLADKLDELIPKHTDEEYDGLMWDYEIKCDRVTNLQNDVSNLEDENERLEDKLIGAENKIAELENKISELETKHED